MSTMTAEADAARETREAPKRTDELLTDWRNARERMQRARTELTSAQEAEKDARNALGKRLMPRDAKDGERIGIWERDRGQRERFLYARRDGGQYSIDEVPNP